MSDFNWTFTTLATETVGDLQRVVRTVDWRLTYVPTGDIISGTAQLGDPALSEFTPFAELTAEHVQVWVEQSIDLDALQAIVSRSKSAPPWSLT